MAEEKKIELNSRLFNFFVSIGRPFDYIKSYVLARKGILVSDKSVGKMNKVRWMVEFLALRERYYQDLEDLKTLYVNLFGLNFVPEEYRKDVEGNVITDFLPLTFFVAPHVMEQFIKKIQEEQSLKEVLNEEVDKYAQQVVEMEIKLTEEEKKKMEEEKQKWIIEQEKVLGILKEE